MFNKEQLRIVGEPFDPSKNTRENMRPQKQLLAAALEKYRSLTPERQKELGTRIYAGDVLTLPEYLIAMGLL